jgi:hypothetical protein
MFLRKIVGGLAVALAVAPFALGCGTVLGHAGMQDIAIHLSPDDPSAEIKINGNVAGKGSGTYQVDSMRDGNTINVACPDGKVGAGGVHREIMPFVVIADAFMLIFPIYIDYADGGMYSLAHEITINLGKPADTSSNQNDFQPGKTSNIPGNGNGNGGQQELKPCPFCGEMRPTNAANCPHCGQR